MTDPESLSTKKLYGGGMKRIKNNPQHGNRRSVQAEITKSIIPKFSFEHYKKLPGEYKQLKEAKASNRKAVRDAGFDPKIRLNDSEPVTGKIN